MRRIPSRPSCPRPGPAATEAASTLPDPSPYPTAVISENSVYTTLSKPEARSAGAHDSVRQILQKLEKLIATAARKAGWSDNDTQGMVRHAGQEYFTALARGESPQAALTSALVSAERTRSIEFIRAAGAEVRARVGALSVLLERELDPKVVPEREIIDACRDAFVENLRAGHSLERAFDAARAASRSRARARAA